MYTHVLCRIKCAYTDTGIHKTTRIHQSVKIRDLNYLYAVFIWCTPTNPTLSHTEPLIVNLPTHSHNTHKPFRPLYSLTQPLSVLKTRAFYRMVQTVCCVAVSCSVLQCLAVSCSRLKCVVAAAGHFDDAHFV